MQEHFFVVRIYGFEILDLEFNVVQLTGFLTAGRRDGKLREDPGEPLRRRDLAVKFRISNLAEPLLSFSLY